MSMPIVKKIFKLTALKSCESALKIFKGPGIVNNY